MMLVRFALLAPANDNFEPIFARQLSLVEKMFRASQEAEGEPLAAVPTTAPNTVSSPLDRNEAIKRIKAGLKARSGKSWSVTGGKGTAWGWIKIDTMPARRRFDCDGNPTDSEFGYMSKDERAELAALLGLDSMHCQGVDIPASSAYRVEYVARAEGREPERFGEQYWD